MRKTSQQAEQTLVDLQSHDECCRDARPAYLIMPKTSRSPVICELECFCSVGRFERRAGVRRFQSARNLK
jgi:hypothetical protein